MQTLYLLNETLEPDFEDAKLKITYKNGSVKYIKMKDAFKGDATADKKITNFDTSLVRSTIMKITYKNHIVDVNYSVIESGMYYLSGYEKFTYVNGKPQVSSSKQYSLSTDMSKSTKSFILLKDSGTVNYYSYSDAKNRWHLYDGDYIENYCYEIVGDKLNIYLGGESPAYYIQSSVKNGVISTYSVNVSKDPSTGLDTGKETFTFTPYNNIVTNVTATNVELKANYKTLDGNEYLQFDRYETLENNSNNMYLKVTYSNYLIYTGSVNLFKEIYVVVGNGMLKNDSLYTQERLMEGYGFALIAYESKNIQFNYKVY